MDATDNVRSHLKGQNLEQIGRPQEAVDLYEAIVDDGFDSTGPYDRLIALHSATGAHKEVARVAEAALENVRTYEDKRAWYERMRSEALKAQSRVPKAAPKPRP